MSKHQAFDQAYSALNREQRQAVDTIDGPVMVVAGPGTGKTQVLTLRIANILLQTDAEPDEILALTFTEAGVQSMRTRLLELIGSPAYQVTISTFHGFAESVIREYPEEFPRIIGARPASEVERVEVVEEIIERSELKLLKPFGDPLHYVRDLLRSISELKREGVTPPDHLALIDQAEVELQNEPDLYHEKGAHRGKMKSWYKDREKQIHKNRELQKVYRAYQVALGDQQLYDFEDMIIELLRALRENEDLLLNLQERYQYLLADEHQDANRAQNQILELLAAHFAPRPNLFLVGDEKQAIFRFQGASLENFYYFQKLYPEVKLVQLSQNYRSGQRVLDSADSLIPAETPLQAAGRSTVGSIEVHAFSQPAVERFFLARDIKSLVETGVPAEEIAILYRENKEADSLVEVLTQAGVPAQVESDQDIYAEPVVKKLLIIARAVGEFGRDEYLAEFLHLDLWSVEPWDVVRLLRQAAEDKRSLFEFLTEDSAWREVKPGFKQPVALREAYELLSTWVKRSVNTDLVRLLEEILRQSGLIAQVLSSETGRDQLDALDSFFQEVRTLQTSRPAAKLDDLFSYLETIRQHNLTGRRKRSRPVGGAVRLMTAHRSKGQEFEYVYITGAVNGRWGNQRRPDKLPLLPSVYRQLAEQPVPDQDRLSDERRLFFVALTRAKEAAKITYAQTDQDGRERLPSQFIEEIRASLRTVMDPEPIEQEFQAQRGQLYQKRPNLSSARLVSDPAWVAEKFKQQTLSVTALNNYLTCPWQYFYRNLLRLPEPRESYLMYGTAVHEALEQLFKHLSRERSFTRSDFLEYFATRLRTQPLTESELERQLERGRKALGGWYDTYQAGWNTRVLTEFYIRGLELTPEVTLSGKIDKLEFEGDDKVTVVDYKTGVSKTRNHILGQTKDRDLSYWRQLVFYRLLLDQYKDGAYQFRAAELDFVEPDKNSGKYRKERFEISDQAVEELTDLIKQTAEEILSLSFWNRTCDSEDCSYCRLRSMLD